MLCQVPELSSLPNRVSLTSLLVLALLLLLAGCARPPWSDPLAPEQQPAARELYQQLFAQQRNRQTCLDADVTAIYENSFTRRATSGYLLFLPPDAVRFVVSNPLGQPLFAFASDGEWFQLVNSLDRTYQEGGLTDLGRAFDLPLPPGRVAWGRYLSAQLPEPEQILEITNDTEGRGMWFALSAEQPEHGPDERILLSGKSGRILARTVYDEDGQVLFSLAYDGWQQGDCCSQPAEVSVTALPYGGRIELSLQQIGQLRDCSPAMMRLTVPSTFTEKPLGTAH